MSKIGTIIGLNGKAWAKAVDGSLRELKVGDKLAGNETLILSAGASIDVSYGAGREAQVITFTGPDAASPAIVPPNHVKASVASPDLVRMVNEDLAAALHAIEAPGQRFYFPGLRGPHMHPQSVHKIIQRLTGFNPHALRHAGATAAYNATRDLRAVQEMLGHASLATTQRYLHLDAEALRRVADATRIVRPLLHLAA